MTFVKTYLTTMAGLVAMAAPAMAGDFAFGFSYFGGHHRGGHVAVGVAVGRPLVVAPAPVVAVPAPVLIQPAPVVVPVVPVQRVWVPPVYRTVTERVWVPTVQTAYRDVPIVDACGTIVGYRREAYPVQSGYWSEVRRQVLVREGFWTTQPVTAPPAPEYRGAPDEGAQPEPAPEPQQNHDRGTIRGPAPLAPRSLQADSGAAGLTHASYQPSEVME